jgi:hypothetical protein
MCNYADGEVRAAVEAGDLGRAQLWVAVWKVFDRHRGSLVPTMDAATWQNVHGLACDEFQPLLDAIRTT